ncbi:MAG TPA: hypothetical protein VER04_24370 [Polyangiaceae bacterium]|nr:hypothetical protein [Polyangiaceae bacterium]
MSDDRFTKDPDDDEANANGERPYLDAPRPGVVRPAKRQPWFRNAPNQFVSGDEILEWTRKAFPEPEKKKEQG